MPVNWVLRKIAEMKARLAAKGRFSRENAQEAARDRLSRRETNINSRVHGTRMRAALQRTRVVAQEWAKEKQVLLKRYGKNLVELIKYRKFLPVTERLRLIKIMREGLGVPQELEEKLEEIRERLEAKGETQLSEKEAERLGKAADKLKALKEEMKKPLGEEPIVEAVETKEFRVSEGGKEKPTPSRVVEGKGKKGKPKPVGVIEGKGKPKLKVIQGRKKGKGKLPDENEAAKDRAAVA